MPTHTITVSAVVLVDEEGRLLTVRKRGTSRFMLPGGKPEGDESPARTALREVHEELGLELADDQLQLLGRFRSAAANEADTALVSTVFTAPWAGRPVAAAEIAELRMLPLDQPLPDDLAPMLEHRVLPMLGSGLRRVTVFAGASAGQDPRLVAAAAELGTALAEHGLGVVYGAGGVGMMGALADAALAAGGEVTGVIPQHLVDLEMAREGLTRLEVVADMHQRKMTMATLGDAFVALPGGIGTLEEFFEALTWLQLGIHAKPVALYDVDGFWHPLLAMLDEMATAGFVERELIDRLVVASTPDELVAALR